MFGNFLSYAVFSILRHETIYFLFQYNSFCGALFWGGLAAGVLLEKWKKVSSFLVLLEYQEPDIVKKEDLRKDSSTIAYVGNLFTDLILKFKAIELADFAKYPLDLGDYSLLLLGLDPQSIDLKLLDIYSEEMEDDFEVFLHGTFQLTTSKQIDAMLDSRKKSLPDLQCHIKSVSISGTLYFVYNHATGVHKLWFDDTLKSDCNVAIDLSRWNIPLAGESFFTDIVVKSLKYYTQKSPYVIDTNYPEEKTDDAPEEISGVLLITVISARNLKKCDLNGKSDPFVVVKCNGIVAKTSVKLATLNPVWNETFEFPVTNGTDEISFKMWDLDQVMSNDALGKAKLTAKLLLEHETVQLPMKKGALNVQGKLKRFDPNEVRASILEASKPAAIP